MKIKARWNEWDKKMELWRSYQKRSAISAINIRVMISTNHKLTLLQIVAVAYREKLWNTLLVHYPSNQSIVIAIITLVALISKTSITHSLLVKKSYSTEMQKINGQCIDPYLQTYEKSVAQGENILKQVNNYQNLEDLQTAQKTGSCCHRIKLNSLIS